MSRKNSKKMFGKTGEKCSHTLCHMLKNSKKADSMYDIYMLNPMAPVMETMRRIWFGSGEVPGGYLAGSIAVSAIVLAAGVWIFQKTQRTFADKI